MAFQEFAHDAGGGTVATADRIDHLVEFRRREPPVLAIAGHQVGGFCALRDHDILSAPGDQLFHTGKQLLFTRDFTFECDRQFMLVEFREQGPFRKHVKEGRLV